MDHNNLDVIGDFIAPLSEFLDNFGIQTHNNHLMHQSPRKNSFLNNGTKNNGKIKTLNNKEVLLS